MGKKTGPKPGDHEKRTKLCGHYLTLTDWFTLKDMAERGGFKSTGALTSAVLEPIIQGRFSMKSAVVCINRIQAFMQSNGLKFDASWADVRDGMLDLFTPPPPIVPEENEDLSQLEEDLEILLEQVRTQRKQQTNNKKHDYANR